MSARRRTTSKWIGSLQVRSLLEHCMKQGQAWPPEATGIYVVSLHPWFGQPTNESEVLRGKRILRAAEASA